MTYCDLQCTFGDSPRLPVLVGEDGAARVRFTVDPGLYQLSVIVDAAAFDWESLYVNLTRFGNSGQRTGPWDFDIREETSGRPLVPAYRVRLDGRDVGMWFFQRVSLEDLERKRFRGSAAVWLKRGGAHEFSLTPHRSAKIRWMSATLEVDPEDRLCPLPEGIASAATNSPISRWADKRFWDEQRRRRDDLREWFGRPLREAFDGAMAAAMDDCELIPLLVAAHHLEERDGAISRALRIVDGLVAMPAWGNPDPDGYSHNGDLGAAQTMLSLSWAAHMLRDELGEARQARLLEKLACQGDRFVELALLNRDYWGGSLLQDHGRKSFNRFAAAALNLYGILPQAESWLRYALPRAMRGFAAMPLDGAIPASSYHAPWMYLDDTAYLRDTLRAMTGEDLYDLAPFRPIVDHLWTILRESDGTLIVPCDFADRVPFAGGGPFYAEMARKFADGRAQWLALRTLQMSDAMRGRDKYASLQWRNALWTFLSFDPAAAAPDPPPPSRRHLVHYPDSGLVQYRDDSTGVTLAARCAPYLGHHAYRVAKGPCDRMASAPGDGHFIVAIDGMPLLVTPDAGYRLHSFLRSCVLIDNLGQIGDIGYPMSIPSTPYRGQEVRSVAWDQSTARGHVRLDLKPAYFDTLDVIAYTRDFILAPTREILCRDQLTLGSPRRLSWLFQGRRENEVTLETNVRCRFGSRPSLFIEPTDESKHLLCAQVAPTDVVFSYSGAGGFKQFDHVRYDSVEALASICMTFRLFW